MYFLRGSFMSKLHYIIFSLLFLSLSSNSFGMNTQMLVAEVSNNQNESANRDGSSQGASSPVRRSRPNSRTRKKLKEKQEAAIRAQEKAPEKAQSRSLPSTPTKGSDSDENSSHSAPTSPIITNKSNESNSDSDQNISLRPNGQVAVVNKTLSIALEIVDQPTKDEENEESAEDEKEGNSVARESFASSDNSVIETLPQSTILEPSNTIQKDEFEDDDDSANSDGYETPNGEEPELFDGSSDSDAGPVRIHQIGEKDREKKSNDDDTSKASGSEDESENDRFVEEHIPYEDHDNDQFTRSHSAELGSHDENLDEDEGFEEYERPLINNSEERLSSHVALQAEDCDSIQEPLTPEQFKNNVMYKIVNDKLEGTILGFPADINKYAEEIISVSKVKSSEVKDEKTTYQEFASEVQEKEIVATTDDQDEKVAKAITNPMLEKIEAQEEITENDKEETQRKEVINACGETACLNNNDTSSTFVKNDADGADKAEILENLDKESEQKAEDDRDESSSCISTSPDTNDQSGNETKVTEKEENTPDNKPEQKTDDKGKSKGQEKEVGAGDAGNLQLESSCTEQKEDKIPEKTETDNSKGEATKQFAKLVTEKLAEEKDKEDTSKENDEKEESGANAGEDESFRDQKEEQDEVIITDITNEVLPEVLKEHGIVIEKISSRAEKDQDCEDKICYYRVSDDTEEIRDLQITKKDLTHMLDNWAKAAALIEDRSEKEEEDEDGDEDLSNGESDDKTGDQVRSNDQNPQHRLNNARDRIDNPADDQITLNSDTKDNSNDDNREVNRPKKGISKIKALLLTGTFTGVIGTLVYNWVKDYWPQFRSQKTENDGEKKDN